MAQIWPGFWGRELGGRRGPEHVDLEPLDIAFNDMDVAIYVAEFFKFSEMPLDLGDGGPTGLGDPSASLGDRRVAGPAVGPIPGPRLEGRERAVGPIAEPAIGGHRVRHPGKRRVFGLGLIF